ncbi:3'-5' exonuclease [Escherichia coli]
MLQKRLFSELGYGPELKVLSANHEEHEAERVTGELIAHHFVNKTQYKDYAILYRGNHQSRVFKIPDAKPHPLQNFRRYVVLLPPGD